MKPYLKVKILSYYGIENSLLGLSLSYKQNPNKMFNVAKKLCFKQFGHNKFLESIMIWLDVKAPRYWWSEADTYRLSTKQSESTMHTLKKELKEIKEKLNNEIEILKYLEEKEYIEKGCLTLEQLRKILDNVDNDIWILKTLIPEGWLQRRIWCMSFKTLQNIIIQRKNHKLIHWKIFINEIKRQLEGLDIKYFLFGDENEY